MLSEAVLNDCVHGRSKILWHGDEIPLKLSQAELSAYEEAKSSQFAVHAYGYKALGAVWGQWCALRSIPIIEIKPKGKKLAVSMDCIYSKRLTDTGKALVEELFKAHATNKAKISIGTWSDCDNLEPDSAKVLAAELIQVWKRHSISIGRGGF